MKLTEEMVRKWPALACVVAGHERHTLAAEAYQEKYGDPMLGTMLGDVATTRAGEELADLFENMNWIRQTAHRAHHDGPLDECQKGICDAALRALGKR